MKPLRVLIVQVAANDASRVVEELQRAGRSIEFELVETTAAMREALEHKRWDVVIADWALMQISGHVALDLLKELQIDLPFIIVSSTSGEEHAVAAMRAGARDYVLKDKLDRLAPVIERELLAQETRAARHEPEVAPRHTEGRMRRMIVSASVGVWFVGAEGKTSFMNRRMAQILGLSAEEAAHASVDDFIDLEDRPAVAERLAQREAGVSRSHEHKFRRKDGSVGWGAFESSPLHDEKGCFEGVLTIMTDVTDRRKFEAAQREAELRFRRLCASGIIGVVVSDTAGVITEANDAFLVMVGYTRDDLRVVAARWIEMTPVEWRPLSFAAKAELLAGRSPRPFEKEYVRKDGTRVPVLVSIALLDENRFLTMVTDLTDRKLAKEANLALEEQLRQSQKMEAVGRLAAGVAHDFNNVLSVVLSYSELLLAELREGDPIRVDIEQIHLAGERAAGLTRQLLMFSRQQVAAPQVLDLNGVLSGLDTMLRRLVGADVEWAATTGASLGRVRADQGSIEQLIMNLVINARDAMPVGGTLTIETADIELDEEFASSHFGAKPGPYVMLSVTDTGTGMSKATLARIFEPFFTTKDHGKGTGLGLSTVHGILQQSGGTAWVHSEPGIGTTFKVYLPRVDAAAEALRPSRGPKIARGSETILLVEDEEQVRDVARGILRRYGYTVLDGRSAGEALLVCERHAGPIHLLVTDVVMPEMSGPELAQRLAQTRPEMRVLFMSGYTDDAAVRHGMVGAAFLQKPITVEALTTKVREAIDSKCGGDNSRARSPLI